MAITAGFTKDFLEKWHKETSHLVVPYNKTTATEERGDERINLARP